MSLRSYLLPALFLAVLFAQSAKATTGSPEVVAYSVRIPDARKNPAATLACFNDAASDQQERMILFMLLMTLGKEDLISSEQYFQVIEQGLVDVYDQIRGHAVHYLEEVYDGEELQKVYFRCTLDKSLLVRYNAAEQMRDYPSAESLPYLDALLSDESIEVRDRAAGTLCYWHRNFHIAGIKALFLRSMESNDIRRAGCAARVLTTFFEMPPRLELLNAYLDAELDKSPPYFGKDNASAIIRMLGAISDPTSKAVLEKATRYSNPYVAADAQAALSKIPTSPK